MKYIRVKWTHSNPDEPVWLFSEVDDYGKEQRKIECFQNGFCDIAGPGHSSGTARLSSQPLPDFTVLKRDPEFEPSEITRQEFEDVWSKRRYKSNL